LPGAPRRPAGAFAQTLASRGEADCPVRSPSRYLTTNGETMSDMLLEGVAQLETQARKEVRGRVRDFRLVVEDDYLVLRGQARTYYAKQLAQEAIMRGTSFPIRANEIEVL
jgi:hypothetical protein